VKIKIDLSKGKSLLYILTQNMRETHTETLWQMAKSLNRNRQYYTKIVTSSVVTAFLLALPNSQILGSMLNIGGVSVHVLSGSLQ
jgi:hypothetical protein